MWSSRVNPFLLDDPACDTVAATNRTTAVQIEICDIPGLGVTVTKTVSSWLVPLTLLCGLVGLALGGLLGAGPIARRFGRAAPPYRWSGLASGALTLAGLAPGAITGLLATIPFTGDLRFATPFWFGPAEILSNGEPATFALVIGLTGFVVTWWRANPQARIRNPALSTSD